MINIMDIVMAVLGAISLIIWLMLFKKGKKFNYIFETDVLDEKSYPLKDIYGMGYAFLEKVKYSYKTRRDMKMRQELEVIYGSKNAEYYLRVIHSQQVTIAITVFVLSFAFYGFARDIMLWVIGVIFAGTTYYYYGTVTEKKMMKRSDELLHDFSEVVSKLALLTNAGMILRDAWYEVAYEGEGELYTEMVKAVDEMNNGVSEVDAIYNFGSRCMIPEIKRFTSTISQSLTKGNDELVIMLQAQSKEVWELKKQIALREGEKAASKLLIPIGIMFVGVLIMLIVPIFANLGI